MENKFFGDNLVQLRKERHISQSDLASQINVTTSAISKWENHKNMPDISMLTILSKYFDISLGELLGTPEIDFQPEILTKELPELVPAPEPVPEPGLVMELASEPELALEPEPVAVPEVPVAESVTARRISRPILITGIVILMAVLIAVAIGIYTYSNQQATMPFRVMNSRTVEDPVWNETITEIGVYYEGTLDNALMSMICTYIERQWHDGGEYGGKSVETLKVYFYSDKTNAKKFSSKADSYMFLFDREQYPE